MKIENLRRAEYLKDEINTLEKAIRELENFDIKKKSLSITEYPDGSGAISDVSFYINGNYNNELYIDLGVSILEIYRKHLALKIAEVETL